MTAVIGRPSPGDVFTADSFADLTSFPVRSIRWRDDGQLRVDFDDDPGDGGPIPDAEVQAVKQRIGGVAEFDPATADLAATKAAVADLIRLINGES